MLDAYSPPASFSALRRWPNARVIRSDAEALSVAKELAAEFGHESAARDRARRLPRAELDRYSASGLWALTVPRKFGGPEVSIRTLAEVTAIISAADSSIGQIPQNHYYMLAVIRTTGSPEQQKAIYADVLSGARLGNALSELGTKTVGQYNTRIYQQGSNWVVEGKKYYSTGALFAHFIPTVTRDEGDQLRLALIEAGAPGLTIVDDWDSFGQRTTGSGTAILEQVTVSAERVLPYDEAFAAPSPVGPIGQILHAAVDQGIARAAIADLRSFLLSQGAVNDPLLIAEYGRLVARLHGADALLVEAGAAVDRLLQETNAERLAIASAAVASAKIATTDISLEATNQLFELGGIESTFAERYFDRHWRNARAHTLHDPVRWKYQAIGNYYLNGVYPPRHGAL